MSESSVVGFAVVSVAIIAVPGPSVLFVVSRTVASGRRHALLTVLGNAVGLYAQVVLVALGIDVIVGGSTEARTALRLIGAAYLIWLGVDAFRRRDGSTRDPDADLPVASRRWSFVPLRDGFVVGVSNPKSLVFLAALLPQYVEPAVGSTAAQVLLLGAVFCGFAIVFDSAWVLAASQVRGWLAGTGGRLRLASVGSGCIMIALGGLLAWSG